MADTVFGKIVRGEIPCHKVYEDERVLAFLDINPLTRGHTLVIPKEEAETLDKLSDESAAALGRALPRICRAVIAATGVSQYNVLDNNGAGAHQAVLSVADVKERGADLLRPHAGNVGPGRGTLRQDQLGDVVDGDDVAVLGVLRLFAGHAHGEITFLAVA